MKRRSCIYCNYRNDKGAKGCTEHGVCSDTCPDYSRRVKWAQWKVPLSQCLFLRYRYRNNEQVKICAVSTTTANCVDSCPQFTRRKKKIGLQGKHNPHVPFYKGKKEICYNGKHKSCKPKANHPWRHSFKQGID